ncbi:hypothetical protein SAMN05216410_0744 [Sanguibacter gelidistatuariae]|uniref:Uncharacterized protein n=1 Tax=Sanguibacter gelidistatuariae TaxID=1814289 RepID=A0A1G6H5C7_9MICO|nr:hypothetical protein [Sanguibacter gelidistatuariae]SDB89391.1 hypothetical protein SAMN05216410_0744 [Sanguibacter gelidistatuariae]
MSHPLSPAPGGRSTVVDGFLRRRPPRRPVAANVPAATKLSLNPAAAAHEPAPRDAAASYGVPRVQAAGHLDAAHPMLALTRLQSAVGSLQVVVDGDAAGCDVLWELDDNRQGSLDRVPLDAGRRPLVSPDKTPGFVLGLRHAQALRRVVFWFPGATTVSVVLLDGTVVRCDHPMSVLAVYQLEGELFLRYDADDYADVSEVRAAYGF